MKMPGFRAEASLFNRGGQYEYLDMQMDRTNRTTIIPAETSGMVNISDKSSISDTPLPLASKTCCKYLWGPCHYEGLKIICEGPKYTCFKIPIWEKC